MPNQQVIELRNRILGVLIRNARDRTHVSRKACADVLGVSANRFRAYEEGSQSISLPEMELLGRYLGVPLHVLRDDSAAGDATEEALPDPDIFLPLRHRIVGARLRQARLESGRTQKELAELLEHSSSIISSYEYGEKPIPVAELELVGRTLGVSLDFFFDADSEIGEWHHLKEEFESFAQLSPELREFILRPINRSYLELAMKLATMPAGALREIAEGLLEITY